MDKLDNLERVNKILKNKEFRRLMGRISKLEEEREFCLHDMNHALDTARIGYIINLEEGLGVEREHIYAAALLHDIGRADEYEKKLSHHEQSAILAEPILANCGFDENEIREICEAIGAHKQAEGDEKGLKKLLYRADKLSRKCFDCRMYEQCYWPKDKKNDEIVR